MNYCFVIHFLERNDVCFVEDMMECTGSGMYLVGLAFAKRFINLS